MDKIQRFLIVRNAHNCPHTPIQVKHTEIMKRIVILISHLRRRMNLREVIVVEVVGKDGEPEHSAMNKDTRAECVARCSAPNGNSLTTS